MNRCRGARVVVGAAVATLVLAACAGPATLTADERRTNLDAYVAGLQDQEGLVGLAVAVDGPDFSWAGADGAASIDLDTGETVDALTPERLFALASITKLYTAALILDLDQSGALSLGDKLSSFVEGWPDGDDITIRELLAMTSGIPDFTLPVATQKNDCLGEGSEGGTETESEWLQAVNTDPSREWGLTEAADMYAKGTQLFAPGTDYCYTNSGYSLLGQIAEQASGESIADAVTSTVIEPAALDATFYRPRADLPSPLVDGYGTKPGENTLLDVADTDSVSFVALESSTGPAGAMYGDAADQAAFTRRLLRGDLLDAESTEALEKTDEIYTDDESGITFSAGLGPDKLENTPAGTVYGHSGDTAGFATATYWSSDTDTAVSVLINQEGKDATGVALCVLSLVDAQVNGAEQDESCLL